MGGKATFISFYFCVAPHSRDTKEANKLTDQKGKSDMTKKGLEEITPLPEFMHSEIG